MRRALFNEIGGFDKLFFMYGEDIDLCYRIAHAGREVWYYPQIKIVHQKGKSSSKRKIRSRFYFYEAMIIFFRKYRKLQEMVFPWWLIWVGIVLQATLNIGSIIARSVIALLMDAVAINAAAWVGLSPLAERLTGQSVYGGGSVWPLAGMHALLSISFLSLFVYNGIYTAKYYSIKNIIFSGLLSGSLFLSGIYFLTSYSVEVFGIAAGLALAASILWRETLPLLVKGLRGRIFAPEKAVIVGHDDDIARYMKSAGGKRCATRVAGVIRIGRAAEGVGTAQIEGYPVLGGMDDLARALSESKADVLLIAAARPWYSEIIRILVAHRNSKIEIRWEAME
jgi:hypothetical protein